jgi:prepilin-type N-terminal cleavage/methylation domain-containing protein
MVRSAAARRGRCTRGFTLIELLVVIAILSMLIAILIPGLNQARHVSKRVACQSNLRNLANAWIEYLDVHDGYFLQGINTNVNYGGQQGAIPTFQIPKPLNMYVDLPDVAFEGAEVFQCPVDSGSRSVQPSYFEYVGTSYETNPMLIGPDRMWAGPRSDPCAEVRRSINNRLRMMNRVRVFNPAKVLLMGDQGWVASWTPWNKDHVEWHAKALSHNVAFLDTHVEFVRVRKGLHVTPDYHVIPFKGLVTAAAECQEEGVLGG